jgi:predicted N-acetyltransferase YhbS
MAHIQGFKVRRMADSDLREVFQLIERENWGWEFAEIQQIYNLDSLSSVVAIDGAQVVGLVTCVDFGSMAFIIHVIVREGWRRKGVGVQMMQEVLSSLDAKEVPSVELHANPEAVEFYDQFSFKRVEDISFCAKDPPYARQGFAPLQGLFSPLPDHDPSMFSDTLADATGYVQADIRKAISKCPPDHAVAAETGGRVTALLLSRTGHDLNGAGPWFMETPDAGRAEAMMNALLSRVPQKRMDVLMPESNEVSRSALASCGFSVMKGGIVRVARSSRSVRAYGDSLLAIGHLGLI